jgi:hypothetical protein
MTKQKNPTSFYRRGTSNPKFGYYSEGNYAIVKPFTQSYFGFLQNIDQYTSGAGTLVSKNTNIRKR